MKTASLQHLDEEKINRRYAETIHHSLLQEQSRLAGKVGEPIFVTIRLVYDGFVEVDIETITGRNGMACGGLLPEVLLSAVETLLYLDEVSGLTVP